jgi:hypothetical protein
MIFSVVTVMALLYRCVQGDTALSRTCLVEVPGAVVGTAGEERVMGNDAYYLFVILACILTLAMPSAGQMLFGVFALGLIVAAGHAQLPSSSGGHEYLDRHDVPGR